MFRSFWKARARTRRRQGFALRDLLATICCLSLLGMLGCMWLDRSTRHNRGSGCLNNVRQLALGIANHESTIKRFPLVSDASVALHVVPPATLGDDASDSAGYSWLVKLLPYTEERILYDEIAVKSEKFATRPFDPILIRGDGSHLSAVSIPAFRCPSYRGDTQVKSHQDSEYDHWEDVGIESSISNYMAIVGTHTSDGVVVENGVIVSRCETDGEGCNGKGLKLRDVGDGISNTIIICESVEPIYSAWFDGQATWIVGLDPQKAGDMMGDGHSGAQATLLGKSNYSTTALPKAWPGRVARNYGPSSEHSSGVVVHAFADAHARWLSTDVDPTVYYRLITRNGGEPVDTNEL